MKRFLTVTAIAGGLLILAGVATAQMWGGPGGGWGGMGPGMMGPGGYGRGHGPGMMGPGGGYGPGFNCPGFGAQSEETQSQGQVTDEQAKELAQQYADKYLAGFTVDKVLPFTGRLHTMYSVELKNDKGEVRTLQVTPYGGVRPFGGPSRRRTS